MKERSSGESSRWTKILKSSPAVAEPSGFVFQVSRSTVHQDIKTHFDAGFIHWALPMSSSLCSLNDNIWIT